MNVFCRCPRCGRELGILTFRTSLILIMKNVENWPISSDRLLLLLLLWCLPVTCLPKGTILSALIFYTQHKLQRFLREFGLFPMNNVLFLEICTSLKRDFGSLETSFWWVSGRMSHVFLAFGEFQPGANQKLSRIAAKILLPPPEKSGI